MPQPFVRSCTIKALARGQKVIVDSHAYYEVDRAARYHALQSAFEFQSADLRAHDIGDSLSPGDLVWAESPVNWYLHCLCVEELARIVHSRGARLAVDITLQPLQDVLALGADVAVTSLTKYPAMGYEMGGAVSTNSHQLLETILHEAGMDGHVMGNESARKILFQMTTLRTRMENLSRNVEYIARKLATHPSVMEVRVPDELMAGGLAGGQLSFRVRSFEHGQLLECAIAEQLRTGDGEGVPRLICTFGAPRTTLEHFGSNIRKRRGLSREETNECLIPDDMVRIGVGCEEPQTIWNALRLALDHAESESRRSLREAA